MDDSPITLKSISVVISIALSLGSGLFYIAKTTAKVEALSDRVGVIEVKQDKYEENITTIKTDMATIKTILEERFKK